MRELINHMLETQRYFAGSARGESASLPAPTPPTLLTDDPVRTLPRRQPKSSSAFGQDGVIEKTGPSLGIAFSDQLLHGWDLARATGQDTTMPEDLAEAAYSIIHGAFPEEQRQGVFKPEVPVPDDASAQERLLAFTGRSPN